MNWFLHSVDTRTRRVGRRGPYETEAQALIAACGDHKFGRRPLLIEGPEGVKVEGPALAGFVAAHHEREKTGRQPAR
jgi:hypothetical protein